MMLNNIIFLRMEHRALAVWSLLLGLAVACRKDVTRPPEGPDVAGTWKGWAFGDTLSVTLAGKPCDSTCTGAVVAGSYFDSTSALAGTFTTGSYEATVGSPALGPGHSLFISYAITIQAGTAVTFVGLLVRNDEMAGTATFVHGATTDTVSIALVKSTGP
jgi:hypothetical protein